MSYLDGMRGLWLRQFGDSSERTATAIAQAMRELAGANTWVQKCAEGMVWQGSFDRDTPIRGTADVQALCELAARYGLTFVPCVVPRFTKGTLIPDGQAQFHAAIGKAAGRLMVDIEYGEGYWEVHPELIKPYFQTLRELAPGVEIIAQPDPRKWSLDIIQVETWAPYVDGFCAQHYVGFSTDWNNSIQEAHNFAWTVARYNTKAVAVTLWGTGDLATTEDFWDLVREDVNDPGPDSFARGFCVFAFGNMNLAELAWTKRLADAALPPPVVPVPEPEPDPVDEHPDQERVLRLGLCKTLADMLHTTLYSEPLDGAALTAAMTQMQDVLVAVAPPAPALSGPAPGP